MNIYENMLPKEPKKGYRGYYPVTNKEEWEQLPALYKAMDWEPVNNPLEKGKLRAVKSVIFDVVYIEPYKIGAKVHVHPENVQKILFCNYKDIQCLLYSISGVELEGGTILGAKWLQDTTTGAFAITIGHGHIVARQGGFQGYVPARVVKNQEGNFEYNQNFRGGKVSYYTYSNPFSNEPVKETPEKKLIEAMSEYALEYGWTDKDYLDALVNCGITQEDFQKCGRGEFVKEYFEEMKAIEKDNQEHTELSPLDERISDAAEEVKEGKTLSNEKNLER